MGGCSENNPFSKTQSNNYSPKKSMTNWGGMKAPATGSKKSGGGASASSGGFGKPSVRMSFGGKKR